MSDAPTLMGLGDAAERLGINPKTLKRWAATTPPRVRLVKLPNGHHRILSTEVERLVAGEPLEIAS